MLAKFQSKKQAILDALKRPPTDYEDLSPKGNLDDEIRELIGEINNLPAYVTTSSCAGRVAVYLEGEAKSQATSESYGVQDVPVDADSSVPTFGGGKGGGKWLYISHEPVELEQLSAPGALLSKFGFSKNVEVAFPPASTAVRFVHLKFEPMILHVLAGSAESAQTMLGAAMAAGFRESGISGIVDSKGRPSVPMVGIRSSGLAVDCIIGFLSSTAVTASGPRIQPMVSEQYLRVMLEMTNERFRQNVQRKERFRQGLLERFAGSMSVPDNPRSDYRRKGGYQSASHRKAEKRAEDMRKREEALERRAQALHRGGALDGAVDRDSNGNESEEVDLGLGVLLIDGEEANGR